MRLNKNYTILFITFCFINCARQNASLVCDVIQLSARTDTTSIHIEIQKDFIHVYELQITATNHYGGSKLGPRYYVYKIKDRNFIYDLNKSISLVLSNITRSRILMVTHMHTNSLRLYSRGNFLKEIFFYDINSETTELLKLNSEIINHVAKKRKKYVEFDHRLFQHPMISKIDSVIFRTIYSEKDTFMNTPYNKITQEEDIRVIKNVDYINQIKEFILNGKIIKSANVNHEDRSYLPCFELAICYNQRAWLVRFDSSKLEFNDLQWIELDASFFKILNDDSP